MKVLGAHGMYTPIPHISPPSPEILDLQDVQVPGVTTRPLAEPKRVKTGASHEPTGEPRRVEPRGTM